MRKWGVAGRHCCDGGEGGTPQLDPALKWTPDRGGNGKERVRFREIPTSCSSRELALHSALTKCMCLRFQLAAALLFVY